MLKLVEVVYGVPPRGGIELKQIAASEDPAEVAAALFLHAARGRDKDAIADLFTDFYERLVVAELQAKHAAAVREFGAADLKLTRVDPPDDGDAGDDGKGGDDSDDGGTPLEPPVIVHPHLWSDAAQGR